MSKKLVNKNISFKNFDDLVQAFKTISAKADVQNVNISGSLRTDEKGNKSSQFTLSWEEAESL